MQLAQHHFISTTHSTTQLSPVD